MLEFDLLQISSSGAETAEDIAAFKQRYSFAFPAAPSEAAAASDNDYGSSAEGSIPRMDYASPEVAPAISYTDKLPKDGEVPDEVLEFFIPEAEEHLQVVTECLLMLEANSKAEDINRLFRAMHTVKGSAAQVGLHRLSAVAHRVEDLIGELRDGHLQPNADIIDICLQSVDVLKKLLHRQWESDAEMRGAIDPLLARIEELAPEEGIQEPPEPSRAGSGFRGIAKRICCRTCGNCGAFRCATSLATSKISAHFSRASGPHDERGGRTRYKSDAHARPFV